MSAAKDQFVCDEHGNRIAVLLDLERYNELLEAIEDIQGRSGLRRRQGIARRSCPV